MYGQTDKKEGCPATPNNLWTSIFIIVGVLVFLYFVTSCKGRRIH